MFYTSNLGTSNLNRIQEKAVPSQKISDDTLPPYHQLNFPFQLRIFTYHPDDKEHTFTLTTLAPEYTIYTTLNSTESKEILKDNLHQHDYYEILFVLEGEVYQIIEHSRHLYTQGSCCILNKYIRHTEEFSTDYRLVFFEISETFLSQLLADMNLNYFKIEQEHKNTLLEEFLLKSLTAEPTNENKSYIDFIPVQDQSWVSQNVHSLFEQMTNELLAPQFGSSYIIKGLFFKLLQVLDNPTYFQTTPVKIGTDKEQELFEKITKILSDSNGRTSRSELEQLLHYSGDRLNKIVKKYTGLNIYDYGMTFCMKMAKKLLSESDLNVSDISLHLGFSNRSHFYGQFKKYYNMTPAEYRKQLLKQ